MRPSTKTHPGRYLKHDGERWLEVERSATSDGFLVVTAALVDDAGVPVRRDGYPVLHAFLLGRV